MTKKMIGLLTILALASACGSDEASDDGAVDLRLEAVARYGSVAGEGTAFTSISGVVPTDSSILVLEAEPPRVAMLGLDGRWQGDIGRAGEGPGELRGPTLVAFSGDTIWVGGGWGRRLEALGPAGESLASYRWTISPDSLGAPAHPVAPLADGSILAGPGSLNISAAASGRVTHRAYLRATPGGESLGEIYREALAPDDFMIADLGDGRVTLGMHPLRRLPLVSVYPDGSGLVAVEGPEPRTAEEATYRIRSFGVDGSEALDLIVPYDPVPAEGWRDHYARELEQQTTESSGSVDRAFVNAIIDALSERRFYPAVTAVKAGPDGSIWVRREETPAGSVRWQVFTREGEPHGSLSTPKDLELVRVSLEEVWAVERNELDVPFLVRMRMVS